MPDFNSDKVSSRSIGVALILTFFGGIIGLQRLYLGRYLTWLAIVGTVTAAYLQSLPILLAIPILIMIRDLWVISGHNFCDISGKIVQPHLLTKDCSLKSFRQLLFLNLFLGTIGAHRFYVGKKLTAIIMLSTVAICGMLAVGVSKMFLFGVLAMFCWAFFDAIMIMTLHFSDDCGIYIAFNDQGSNALVSEIKAKQNPHTMPKIIKKEDKEPGLE